MGELTVRLSTIVWLKKPARSCHVEADELIFPHFSSLYYHKLLWLRREDFSTCSIASTTKYEAFVPKNGMAAIFSEETASLEGFGPPRNLSVVMSLSFFSPYFKLSFRETDNPSTITSLHVYPRRGGLSSSQTTTTTCSVRISCCHSHDVL